jgi:hypothetical protein
MAVTRKPTANPASAAKPAVDKPKITKKPAADTNTDQPTTRSMADAFDSAQPAGQVAPGKYEAILVDAVLQALDDKGRSARISYEIAQEGDSQGNKLTQFYKLFEAGSTEETPIVGKGADYMKRDLAILGYGDARFADLEDVFETLKDEMPGVVVTVKQNQQYTNVYLGGLVESSPSLDEYRENRQAKNPSDA